MNTRSGKKRAKSTNKPFDYEGIPVMAATPSKKARIYMDTGKPIKTKKAVTMKNALRSEKVLEEQKEETIQERSQEGSEYDVKQVKHIDAQVQTMPSSTLHPEQIAFMNAVMDRIDMLQKSFDRLHTSRNLPNSMPIEHEEFVMENPIEQCDVANFAPEVVPEDESEYPFQKFINEKLPKLSTKDKRLFKDLRNYSGGLDGLAYFLFLNNEVSDKTKNDYRRMFMMFIRSNVELDHFDVYQFFKKMNKEKTYNKNYIRRMYNTIKRVLVQSYGMDRSKFPQSNFKNNEKLTGVEDRPSISPEIIRDACIFLDNQGCHTDSLLLHTMFALAMRASEPYFLRFEDLYSSMTGYSIKVMRPKIRKVQTIMIDKELFTRLNEHKERKQREGEYILETRQTNNKKSISGHFIFNITGKDLYYRLKVKYRQVLGEHFDIIPKDMRRAAVAAKTGEEHIGRAAKLAGHTNTRVTDNNYLAAQQPFSMMPERDTKAKE